MFTEHVVIASVTRRRNLQTTPTEGSLSSVHFDLSGPISDGYLIIIKWQSVGSTPMGGIFQFAWFTEPCRHCFSDVKQSIHPL